MEILLEHMGKGFVSMLIISMPCVLVAASIGLVVGILQAVTQVQEQTIAAAPKILGVFLLIMLLGNMFTHMLMNYMYESANLAFNIIPKNEEFVLPPDYAGQKVDFFKQEQERVGQIKTPDIDEVMKNPGKTPYMQQKDKVKLIQSGQHRSAGPDFLEKKTITGR